MWRLSVELCGSASNIGLQFWRCLVDLSCFCDQRCDYGQTVGYINKTHNSNLIEDENVRQGELANIFLLSVFILLVFCFWECPEKWKKSELRQFSSDLDNSTFFVNRPRRFHVRGQNDFRVFYEGVSAFKVVPKLHKKPNLTSLFRFKYFENFF